MTTARTDKLDLRLTPAAKRALQQAARSQNRTLSEFVLESALARAEAMLPPTRLSLDEDRWSAFVAALDAPPRATPRLAELMGRPSVFEQEGGG